MNMNTLLHQMQEKEASDLHIKVGSPPGYRIDGILKPIEGLERITVEKREELAKEVVAPERWEEFLKSGDLDFGYSVPKLARFRVNVMKQRGTCAMVIRKIPAEIPSLEELGLPEICRTLSDKPRGLVLVTGPTGSGKSTTLAAMVNHVNNTINGHILTMEDPIEFIHADKKCFVNQREIGADTKDFQSALRRALRQDPDVILIGELRDLETISLATTAAETGHLVFGTLHTTSAMQTIDRLIDAFPHEQQSQIRTQLSLTLQGVISQTLVQKIGGGRVAAHEIMIATDAVRASIREAKTPQLQNILTTGSKYGMITLEDSLIKLAKSGQITPETAVASSNNPNLVRETLGIAPGVAVAAKPGPTGQTPGQSLGSVKLEGMRQPVMRR